MTITKLNLKCPKCGWEGRPDGQYDEYEKPSNWGHRGKDISTVYCPKCGRWFPKLEVEGVKP